MVLMSSNTVQPAVSYRRAQNGGTQQYTEEEINALVAEADLRGLICAAHAHSTAGIQAVIGAGVNSIEYARFLDVQTIAPAIEHGTYFSMDIDTTEYILQGREKADISAKSIDKERVVGTKHRDSFRKAAKAGVKIVFGTVAKVYPHGNNAKQFSIMVQFGMTPLQAIHATTINAATLLGKQQLLDSIKERKLADLIAIPANPLEDIKKWNSV